MQTSLVHDSTLLSLSGMYWIDGYFYRYVGRDFYASTNAPRYSFRPIPGQRRKADVLVNHRKLTARVYRMEGVTVGRYTAASGRHVQLALF